MSEDERETTGRRALLNLGHTVGHAIEAASRSTPTPLLHGEAVALGLLAAARVSTRLGLCPPSLERRVALLLTLTGLPTDLDTWLGDEVLAYVAVDKKRAGDRLRFIALEDVGRPKLIDLPLADLRAAVGSR